MVALITLEYQLTQTFQWLLQPASYGFRKMLSVCFGLNASEIVLCSRIQSGLEERVFSTNKVGKAGAWILESKAFAKKF